MWEFGAGQGGVLQAEIRRERWEREAEAALAAGMVREEDGLAG